MAAGLSHKAGGLVHATLSGYCFFIFLATAADQGALSPHKKSQQAIEKKACRKAAKPANSILHYWAASLGYEMRCIWCSNRAGLFYYA
jgi:hypothetical protein